MGKNFRSSAKTPATFRFGEFTFDCASRQLWQQGVERHLSPKAQQLLQMLIAARPRALSRKELYDALWPATFVCETNLACLINEVRKTLGDDARDAQYIRTVHGFGYSFCGEVSTWGTTDPEVAGLIVDGRHHVLHQGENAIGRSTELQIVINNKTVSRHHAVITVTGTTFTLHDLGSTNGTFVDEQRITRSPVPLTLTSQLRFGGVAAALTRDRHSSTGPLPPAEMKRRVAEHSKSA